MPSLKNILSVFAVSIFSFAAVATGSEFGTGTIELGGYGSIVFDLEGNFNSVGLEIRPTCNLYLNSILYSGILGGFNGYFYENSSSTSFYAGPQGGVLLTLSEQFHLYGGAGAAIQSNSQSFSDFPEMNRSYSGFLLQLFGGMKFRLSENFFLNGQPEVLFSSMEGNTSTGFNIAFGFTGLINAF